MPTTACLRCSARIVVDVKGLRHAGFGSEDGVVGVSDAKGLAAVASEVHRRTEVNHLCRTQRTPSCGPLRRHYPI